MNCMMTVNHITNIDFTDFWETDSLVIFMSHINILTASFHNVFSKRVSAHALYLNAFVAE